MLGRQPPSPWQSLRNERYKSLIGKCGGALPIRRATDSRSSPDEQADPEKGLSGGGVKDHGPAHDFKRLPRVRPAAQACRMINILDPFRAAF